MHQGTLVAEHLRTSKSISHKIFMMSWRTGVYGKRGLIDIFIAKNTHKRTVFN